MKDSVGEGIASLPHRTRWPEVPDFTVHVNVCSQYLALIP